MAIGDTVDDALQQGQSRFDPDSLPVDSDLEAPAEDTAGPAPTAKRYKYDSLEAFDRGYRESERRMTLAVEEAKVARERAAALEAELAESRRQAEVVAEQTRVPLSKIMAEIGNMDQADDQYYDQIANRWEAYLTPLIETRARAIVQSEAKSLMETWQRQAREAALAESRAAEARDHATAFLREETTRVGLDLDVDADGIPNNPEDTKLFWEMIAPAVDAAMPTAGYEERIREAVKRVPLLRAPTVLPTAPLGEAPAEPIPPALTVERRRADVRPMGRQSAGPGGPGSVTSAQATPVKPLTVDEGLAAIARTRRI